LRRTAVFLRGINLGRRRLTNEELVRPFTDARLEGAEAFIASGNVVIDEPGLDPAEVEARVEAAFVDAFGFEADAFVRPLADLPALTEREEVRAAEEDGFTPHVIFLKAPLAAEASRALQWLETPDDRFSVLGRELLWLRRGRLTDSEVETRHLERALGGVPNTMRKVTTLRRMAARFGGDG
jgi:uncharacterized protein (DUF1697 family)